MISYDDALDILHRQEKLSPIRFAAPESCGLICADSVISATAWPHFRSAAMDGFAVRHKDIKHGSSDQPVGLAIVGSIAAGSDVGEVDDSNNTTREIMTGAVVPDSYDTIVKIEDVRVVGETAYISAPAEEGNHVRPIGADFNIGDRIAESGTPLTPFHSMAFATLGVDKILVYPQPKICVLSTGKEIVDDPVAVLAAGQIRNASAPYLLSQLRALDLPSSYGGLIADNPDLFAKRMEHLLPQYDLIISTGAVSVGKYDFIPDSLRTLGAEILFHRVKARPAAPTLYARFDNGTHYFGLAGNPISSVIGFQFFVLPLLRRIMGAPAETYTNATLAHDFKKPKDICLFQKAICDEAGRVSILSGQESFKIKPLLIANCWAIIPAGNNFLGNGDYIKISRF